MQDPLVGYATDIGWTYLPPDEVLSLRHGEGGTLLYPVLRDKLIELNPGVVTAANVEEVIGRIESVRNNIEGNAEVLAWLRGERSVYVEAEKRQRNVTLIEFDHVDRNSFHVTEGLSRQMLDRRVDRRRHHPAAALHAGAQRHPRPARATGEGIFQPRRG